jgi:hypothetical protein
MAQVNFELIHAFWSAQTAAMQQFGPDELLGGKTQNPGRR